MALLVFSLCLYLPLLFYAQLAGDCVGIWANMLQNWLNESVVSHAANESMTCPKWCWATLLAQSDSPVVSVGLGHKCICLFKFFFLF